MKTLTNGQFSSINRFRNHILLLYIILGFLLIGLFLPLEKVFYSYIKLYKELDITLITIKTDNLLLIKQELEKTDQDLKEVKDNLKELSYWAYVPFFKNYYADVLHLTKSTECILLAWTLLTNHVKTEILPQEFSYKTPIKGEIKNSIIYSDKKYLKTNRIQDNFLFATQEIEAIDISHYPKYISETIEKQINKAKNVIEEY